MALLTHPAFGHPILVRIRSALQSRLVAVLQGHGAYARGATPWEALHWITALEESAHIAWLRR